MLHKAWNSKGEMPFCFPRSSIKFQGHTGQNITDFDPNWVFPDYRPVAAFKSLRFALFKFQQDFQTVSCHISIVFHQSCPWVLSKNSILKQRRDMGNAHFTLKLDNLLGKVDFIVQKIRWGHAYLQYKYISMFFFQYGFIYLVINYESWLPECSIYQPCQYIK